MPQYHNENVIKLGYWKHVNASLDHNLKRELEEKIMTEDKSQIDIDLEEKNMTVLTAINLKNLIEKIKLLLNELEKSKFPKNWTHIIDTVKSGYKQVDL